MNIVTEGSQKQRKTFNGEAEAEDISVSAPIGRAINRYFELENNSRKGKMS